MSIVHRWNTRRFIRDEIEEVAPVVGVYMLLTRDGYVNYVGSSRNLRSSLLHHQRRGDIPAHEFTAYQTNSQESALRLSTHLIFKYEPYYNDY